MSVAINAKDRLDGANEITDLGGDLVMSKDLDSGQTQTQATTPTSSVSGLFQNPNEGVAKITFSTITTPTEKSVLIIIVAAANVISVATNSTKDWLLKRDTTTIDTFSLVAQDSNSLEADVHIFVDANPSTGTFDYTLVEDDAAAFGAITAQLFFIKGTDTHAVNVVTPDTHDTKESGVSVN